MPANGMMIAGLLRDSRFGAEASRAITGFVPSITTGTLSASIAHLLKHGSGMRLTVECPKGIPARVEIKFEAGTRAHIGTEPRFAVSRLRFFGALPTETLSGLRVTLS